MSRGRKRLLFIGGTERGKSTQIIKLIDSRNEAVIIHDTNNQPKYWKYPEISLEQFRKMKKGKYRCLHPDYREFWQVAFDHFQHGLIVSEDASNYLGEKRDKIIYPNLIALRHPDHDVDITMVTHSVQDTPAYIIRQCNEIFLFKTGDSWSTIRDRFPDHVREQAERIFNEVNNSDYQYIWRRIIILKTGTK
jgi:hypothetical protein